MVHSNSYSKRPRIFICGATGVGKSSFAEKLALCFGGEIINADVFQMYDPLTIGTAKPDLSQVVVPHHLFSICDTPGDYTVIQYRKKAFETIVMVEAMGKIPCIVGGSGFYVYSLFFPPQALAIKDSKEFSTEHSVYKKFTHEDLCMIDPKRAREIHPSDQYRIQRACEIFYAHGILPSACVPQFNPIDNAIVFFVEREREELYSIIDTRVDAMIDNGWIHEVAHLTEEWRDFVRKKNVLGYPQLLDYLQKSISLDNARAYIKQITRNYAKRQMTFNRRFFKKLQEHAVRIHTVNLTLSSSDLYIEQYCKELF